MSQDVELETLSVAVGQALSARKCLLTCAESCTGGWVAEVVTATAGSSAWFERGFVTYSNAAKMDMLGVSASTLAKHGAVSEAVASEMATGALRHSQAQVSLAISGIAGPGGGSAEKPVGTVCFAWGIKSPELHSHSLTCHFSGTRHEIRRAAVIKALQGVLDQLAQAQTMP